MQKLPFSQTELTKGLRGGSDAWDRPQASFVLTNDFMQRPAGVKVWDGQAWVARTASVWSGQAWVERPVRVWGGQAWTSPAG